MIGKTMQDDLGGTGLTVQLAGVPIMQLEIRNAVERDSMLYNTTMFKEAGIAAPPKNWDEMISTGKKLTKYDAQGNVTRSGLGLRLFGAGSGVAAKWCVLPEVGRRRALRGVRAGQRHVPPNPAAPR